MGGECQPVTGLLRDSDLDFVQLILPPAASGAMLDVGSCDGINKPSNRLRDRGHGITEPDCLPVLFGVSLHGIATWSPDAVGFDPSRAD